MESKRLEKLKKLNLITINKDEYQSNLLKKMSKKEDMRLNRGIFKCIEYIGSNRKEEKNKKSQINKIQFYKKKCLFSLAKN